MMSRAAHGLPNTRAQKEFPGRREVFASALLAFVALCCTVPLAVAEDAEPEAEASYVDYIVVTGTRITRRDYESASPIVTIMPELFESVGAPTVEDALNRLPQLVPSFAGTSNNPHNDGQAFIDLRGLGPQATLVLLDGRRLTPANGLGVVDVNLIPPTLIERWRSSAATATGGMST